ncbi:MAG: hypothetical protein OHK0022_42330 [Roseiflexaceae bacterium]
MDRQTIIVGHLAPDLDCLTAIWMLMRFGDAAEAELHFVPAGATLNGQPPDANPRIIHVDTGGGRYDHHQRASTTLSASELVRRALRPSDMALERMVRQVTQIDTATAAPSEHGFFNISALIAGYNLLFPTRPHHVAYAMLPNLDAWYEHELRQVRLEQAFSHRIEFHTRWGLGIAMESQDGGSSKLAYGCGAILYAYRDGHGWMGIAAQSRSKVDLTPVYRDLRKLDGEADWYLHPNHRLLLCGTAKSPPRIPSRLSLLELVDVLRAT